MRLTRTLALAGAVLLSWGTAGAAVGVRLSARSGVPGHYVYASTGVGFGPGCCGDMPVYLVDRGVRLMSSDGIPLLLRGPPTGRRYHRMGALHWIHRGGPGTSRLRIPRRTRGLYHVAIYCPSCAPGPRGSVIESGAFTVT